MKRAVLEDSRGMSKAPLHSRACLAHHSPVPQEGLFVEIRQGSKVLDRLVSQGKKAISSGYFELHGHLNHIHLLVGDDGEHSSGQQGAYGNHEASVWHKSKGAIGVRLRGGIGASGITIWLFCRFRHQKQR